MANERRRRGPHRQEITGRSQPLAARRAAAHQATQVPLRREKPLVQASATTPDALNTQLAAPAGQALQAGGVAVSSVLYPSTLQAQGDLGMWSAFSRTGQACTQAAREVGTATHEAQPRQACLYHASRGTRKPHQKAHVAASSEQAEHLSGQAVQAPVFRSMPMGGLPSTNTQLRHLLASSGQLWHLGSAHFTHLPATRP